MGMRLYVGNLSYSVTSESLEALFAEYGHVKSASGDGISNSRRVAGRDPE